MDKITKVACDIFVIKQGKLLLGKRKNAAGEGTWGLPGRHLNYGEKLIDAAKRELKEEIGVKNVELKLVTITDGIRKDVHYINVGFLLDDFGGEIRLMESDKCSEWKFFELNKLPENIFQPHTKILKTFLSQVVYLH